jgi:hypothetical protein
MLCTSGGPCDALHPSTAQRTSQHSGALHSDHAQQGGGWLTVDAALVGVVKPEGPQRLRLGLADSAVPLNKVRMAVSLLSKPTGGVGGREQAAICRR